MTRPDVEGIAQRAKETRGVLAHVDDIRDLLAYVEELETALARFARKYEPALNAADLAWLRALPLDPQGFPLPYDRMPRPR